MQINPEREDRLVKVKKGLTATTDTNGVFYISATDYPNLVSVEVTSPFYMSVRLTLGSATTWVVFVWDEFSANYKRNTNVTYDMYYI